MQNKNCFQNLCYHTSQIKKVSVCQKKKKQWMFSYNTGKQRGTEILKNK